MPRYGGAELAAGQRRGRISLVQPTGDFEDDPNVTDKRFPGNPTQSFRSRAPLRVVGELTDWVGHQVHLARRGQVVERPLRRCARQGRANRPICSRRSAGRPGISGPETAVGKGDTMPIVLLFAGLLLFVAAVMLSLADTGDSTNWYSWAALAASAVAVLAGVRGIVRARRSRRDTTA